MLTGLRYLVAMLYAAFGTAVLPAQAVPLWATLPDVPALPHPDLSGYVAHNGARLYYAVFNRFGGSPVILLHGGMATSNSWGFEVPRLTPRHKVIVMDTRGHGPSTFGTARLSYGQFASDAVAVLDAVMGRRASVVGLSDGGVTGLILAIRYPARIDRLLAWGANFNTHSESSAPPNPIMKGVGARYVASMQAQYRALSPTPDGFPTLRAALFRLYATEPNISPAELGGIKAKTVIADGDHEQFIARGHIETLARLMPEAKLVILSNVSHGGPQQAPAAFHSTVAALLD